MLSNNSCRELLIVLESTPNLTAGGFKHNVDCPEKRLVEILGCQTHDYTTDQWQACCEFLNRCQVGKQYRDGSYNLKHVVERWCEAYVCNGLLIAALIHCKIPFKENGINAKVAIRAYPVGEHEPTWVKLFMDYFQRKERCLA
jgi:hypothetical protein